MNGLRFLTATEASIQLPVIGSYFPEFTVPIRRGRIGRRATHSPGCYLIQLREQHRSARRSNRKAQSA